jgi:hypothetical protein
MDYTMYERNLIVALNETVDTLLSIGNLAIENGYNIALDTAIDPTTKKIFVRVLKVFKGSVEIYSRT